MMKAELKTITPAWAAKVLATKNNRNRPVNVRHVEDLARDITNGRWKLNGDTICLNGDMLIDGQHRLKAVVMAGISIKSFVIEGLESDVFDTKDIGKRRSAGDTLAIRGEVNACRLAATLAVIDQYCTARPDKKVRYTNMDIEAMVERYPGARASVQGCRATKGLLPPSVLDACHYLFSQKDAALADDFAEKTLKGAGLEEGNPWLALRERLVGNSIAKAKLDKWHLMALCIKAWNAAREGRLVKNLKWQNGEDFPIIK